MPLVITIPFSPILWQLGPLTIRWYGLGYAAAFLFGLWLVGRHLRRHNITERDYGDMAFWAIVVGLIAARLYYVVQNNVGYYLQNPQHILALWEGGMAYFGAVFAVPIFLFFYCRWRNMPFWVIADAAALFAGIGQPIGRIGNIFNGDIVGYPSDLPWAVRYTNPQTFAPEIGVAYQPAAVYELLTGLVILGILLTVRRRVRMRPGGLFLLYLGLYAVSQFLIFFLRDNSITAFGLKQAQLSAIVLAAITLVLWLIWHRTSRPVDAGTQPAPATATAAASPESAAGPAEIQQPQGWVPRPAGALKPAPEAQTSAPEAQKPAPEARKPAPEAQKPEPEAPKPAPEAQKPEPEAPKPAPEAQKPEPEAPKPAPEAQKPAPEAQKPAPEAQKPAPEAQKPAPEAQKPPAQGEKPPAEPQKPPTEASSEKDEAAVKASARNAKGKNQEGSNPASSG